MVVSKSNGYCRIALYIYREGMSGYCQILPTASFATTTSHRRAEVETRKRKRKEKALPSRRGIHLGDLTITGHEVVLV